MRPKMSGRLKEMAERLLVDSGLATAVGSIFARSTAILAYHNVVPRGERACGDLSLHIEQDRFGDHLDLLQETHDVVPLAALARGIAPDASRPRAAITFDDGYLGTLTAGAEELRRRELPATVFVSPGLMDGPGFWWDLIASSNGNGLPKEIRRHALISLAGRQERVLEWAQSSGLPTQALPDHAKAAPESVVLMASEKGGLTLGSHTWAHPDLTRIGPEERGIEFTRSLDWLERVGRAGLGWLSYPYGAHDPAVVREAAGWFEWGLAIDGGLAERKGKPLLEPFSVPRINIPRGLSPRGLRLRLSGLLE